jgi:hypothetical protein
MAKVAGFFLVFFFVFFCFSFDENENTLIGFGVVYRDGIDEIFIELATRILEKRNAAPPGTCNVC